MAELPESKYKFLVIYCLERQEIKGQVIGSLIRSMARQQSSNKRIASHESKPENNPRTLPD